MQSDEVMSVYNIDRYFKSIDNEFKAYLLGWISGIGEVRGDRVSLSYIRSDIAEIAEALFKGFGKHLNKNSWGNGLEIMSRGVSSYIHAHLGNSVRELFKFPQIDSNLTRHFIRGCFESTLGQISDVRKEDLFCKFSHESKELISSLSDVITIPHNIEDNSIEFYSNNALDFLGMMYEGCKYYTDRGLSLYRKWANKISSPGIFKWAKTRADATPPSKSRVSDSGYDLVVIDRVKTKGKVEFYDTGIKISPAYGWYFDLVPRSSITKTGYILANSVGIIDRTYRGSILVPLVKIDPEMPDLEKGSRVVQIIPRQIVHVEWKEVDDLDETDRGVQGFGSTGN